MTSTRTLLVFTICNLLIFVYTVVEYLMYDEVLKKGIERMMKDTCLCNDYKFQGCTNRAPVETIDNWKQNFQRIIYTNIFQIQGTKEIFLLLQFIPICYTVYLLTKPLIIQSYRRRRIHDLLQKQES